MEDEFALYAADLRRDTGKETSRLLTLRDYRRAALAIAIADLDVFRRLDLLVKMGAAYAYQHGGSAYGFLEKIGYDAKAFEKQSPRAAMAVAMSVLRNVLEAPTGAAIVRTFARIRQTSEPAPVIA